MDVRASSEIYRDDTRVGSYHGFRHIWIYLFVNDTQFHHGPPRSTAENSVLNLILYHYHLSSKECEYIKGNQYGSQSDVRW